MWTVERCPNNVGARVHLYLRKGLPTEVADKFRAMCVRDVLPDCSFDSFTVTSLAAQVRALQGVG